MAVCTICEVRRPKRYCTARGEDICAQCCATEREVSINCPYECSYLRESRHHVKKQLDPATMPYPDVHIDSDFMQRSDIVLMLMSAFLNKALQPVPNATDADVREALDAIVVSYRDGVETTPQGEIAAGIVTRFREKIAGLVTELKDREAGQFADKAFMGVAVFMARVAHGYDNGRPRGRAYAHYLRETFPE